VQISEKNAMNKYRWVGEKIGENQNSIKNNLICFDWLFKIRLRKRNEDIKQEKIDKWIENVHDVGKYSNFKFKRLITLTKHLTSVNQIYEKKLLKTN
jgi:hypothetical protein